MSIQVATVTSRIPGPSEPYYRYKLWHDSLTRFGVEPTVIGMGELWLGLLTKPKRMRDWLRDGNCKADLLLWSDSYDVVFTAPPDAVEAEYRRLWGLCPVLYNAERGLWPRGDLADYFKDRSTPWAFLNSGLILGRPADILRILEWMPLDDSAGDCLDPFKPGRRIEPNDQGWHQMAYSARPVPMMLDTRCEVFQTCSACSMDDFDLTGDKVKNKITGTTPLVFHFNGGSKNDLLPAMLHKWNLA